MTAPNGPLFICAARTLSVGVDAATQCKECEIQHKTLAFGWRLLRVPAFQGTDGKACKLVCP